MRTLKAAFAALACALASGACAYIVVPPEEEAAGVGGSEGWAALATQVGPADGGALRIELTIRNDTGDWSAMQAAGTAELTSADGGTTSCSEVVVGTGGHRLAPGMQMRGFVAGPKSDPKAELIRVECAGAEAGAGSTLSFDYSYVTGQYNYYDPDARTVATRMEVALDAIAADLTYPIAEPVEGLILPRDTEITGINDVKLLLVGVERGESGLEFTWQTTNPGEYPTYVHIGLPPVIGADGILYGYYESPDLESVPVSPAGGTAEWVTATAVPSDVGGFHVLLSVESKKQRLFVNYAIDISDV